MKHFVFLLLIVLLSFTCTKEDEVDEVVVYAYSSFTGEWGLGPKIAKMFEDKTGTKVRFITCKDSGAVLHHAIRESSKADVVLGIDNFVFTYPAPLFPYDTFKILLLILSSYSVT